MCWQGKCRRSGLVCSDVDEMVVVERQADNDPIPRPKIQDPGTPSQLNGDKLRAKLEWCLPMLDLTGAAVFPPDYLPRVHNYPIPILFASKLHKLHMYPDPQPPCKHQRSQVPKTQEILSRRSRSRK